MNQVLHDAFVKILHKELIPALGCTDPIVVAYAAAKARQVLGQFPDRLALSCSGNIIKNVKSVVVPNSGGMRGMNPAGILGVVGGNADKVLEVLKDVTEADLEKTRALLEQNFCTCDLAEGVANLYVKANVFTAEHSASVTITEEYTNIIRIEKDGEVLFSKDGGDKQQEDFHWEEWDLKTILEFAETVDVSLVSDLLENQIRTNTAISDAGLQNEYGAQIGRTLMESSDESMWLRAKVRTAAAADARMGGCPMPVVINSGSGNQGLTCSLPVISVAEDLGVSREKLYRALVLSNLTGIFQKHYIGSMSAFCGATTAAAASGAAITWLHGGDYQDVANTVTNAIANVGGMVCDGAKASCAAKIASAVEAAILAHKLSLKGRAFQPGDGILQQDPEASIRGMGYVGRVGMKSTDVEILNLMLGNVDLKQ